MESLFKPMLIYSRGLIQLSRMQHLASRMTRGIVSVFSLGILEEDKDTAHQLLKELHEFYSEFLFLIKNSCFSFQTFTINTFLYKMNINNKLFSNINMRITFYSQVVIGVSSNAFLLLFNIFMFILGHRPRFTHLPISLLALSHIVILLIEGFITADIFTTQARFWDDITCKSVIYLYRLMRGLSICVTGQLSVLQAITLSPRSSYLAKFKHKTSCDNLCFLFFLWVFYTSISSHLVISIAATPNLTSQNILYITESCSLLSMNYFLQHILLALLTFRDTIFIGIVSLSGGYIVILLRRHKKQSQHLHSTKISLKASPEQRAIRTILLLMCFFVIMTVLDIISHSRIVLNNNPIFYCIQILMAHGYATVSPFVFITTEKRIINFLRIMCGRQ
ncbi:vomeronasal type-1 receptor 48-like [Fukomys damarensis]|uniref:vomeronasal type-1 receptor 48-like n=1 Tax=Fukomys damarensis TaxID=885580 RepID=UPI0008FF24A0|nr:vomeronasal type-1 receptor 48-like [Fukomys damarensis]